MRLVNVMTPLPLFFRKDVILRMLQARLVQEFDSKGFRGVLFVGGGLGLWRGYSIGRLG